MSSTTLAGAVFSIVALVMLALEANGDTMSFSLRPRTTSPPPAVAAAPDAR